MRVTAVNLEFIPLALTFLEPALLLGLPAASIPIIIHLWNRRRYADMEWAAIQFVLAALAVERRRILLREYFLLFLRMLAIVVLVLAAARPVPQSPVAVVGTPAATGWVFLLDDSLSMLQKGRDSSCFARAKEIIRSIVTSASPGDMFCLIGTAQSPRWYVELAVADREAFLRTLDEFECRNTRNDWSGSLRAVAERLKLLRDEQPQLARFQVVVLTDGQREPWQRELRTQRSGFQDLIGQIMKLAEVMICQVPTELVTNFALTQLEPMPASCLPNEDITLSGLVEAFGGTQDRPQRVEWLIDGQKVGETPLEWGQKPECSFVWSCRISGPGEHIIEAALPEDGLVEDNRRRVVVRVQDQIRVLCVDGRYSPIPFQGASDYIRLALAPQDIPTKVVPIQIDVVPEGRLAEKEVTKYDVVFLCDVAQIDRVEARLLEQYLHTGGGLVVFCGPQLRPAAYNTFVVSEASEAEGLFPGTIEAIPGDVPPVMIGQVNTRHPLFQVFAGKEGTSLARIPVRRYMEFRGAPQARYEVVATLSNGMPLIVVWRSGLGRGILVTTSADLNWTSLPVWPAWVPLIQEMRRYLQGAAIEPRTLTSGQPLSQVLPVTLAATRAHAVVTDPRGLSTRENLTVANNLWQWTYDETDWCGVYRGEIHLGGTPRLALFAVNAPREESDTQTTGFESLISATLPGVRLVSPETLRQQARAAIPGAAIDRHTYSRMLLLLLLVIGLAELLIAHWRLR